MFAATLLNDLCDTYGIGRPMLTSSFLRSEANQSYTLITTEGQYSVLCIDQNRSLRAIGCEHQLIRYLQRHGFPTPRLLPTRYGTTVALVHGQLYVLAAACEGTSYDRRQPQHLHAAVTALSTFHRLADGFAHPTPAESDSSLDQLHDQAASMLAIIEQRIASSVTLKRHKAMHHVFASLRCMSSTLQHELCSMDGERLPQTIIHGNYGPEALLFEDTLLTTVYGYEQARYAPRLLDLAQAMAAFSCNEEAVPGETMLDLHTLRSFLAIYSEQCELSPCELELLPMVLRCAWLNVGLRHCASTSLIISTDEMTLFFKSLLHNLEWLDDHAGTLFNDIPVVPLIDLALAA